MHLTMIVPTLNRYDLLVRLLASVRAGTRVPDKIYVVDNGGACPSIPDVDIVHPCCNLGCSASWNLGLRIATEAAIISNDDVVVRADTIERIEHAGLCHPLVCCAGKEWGFLLQRLESVEDVGWYDEEFWPAYYEDSDYYRRTVLLGKPPHVLHDMLGDASGSTSTTSALNPRDLILFRSAYARNRQRYISKWGGDLGHEQYTTPFNR